MQLPDVHHLVLALCFHFPLVREMQPHTVNGPATYALTGVEVGACQKPQLADYVPAAYWLSG